MQDQVLEAFIQTPRMHNLTSLFETSLDLEPSYLDKFIINDTRENRSSMISFIQSTSWNKSIDQHKVPSTLIQNGFYSMFMEKVNKNKSQPIAKENQRDEIERKNSICCWRSNLPLKKFSFLLFSSSKLLLNEPWTSPRWSSTTGAKHTL